MVIRQQQEAIARAAEAQRKQPSTAAAGDEDAMDLDEEDGYTKEGGEEETEPVGSKVIVIHPGSQNLRIGLASDALPKTIPMVIARRSDKAEAEENEPSPKRIKDEDSGEEAFFGEEVCVVEGDEVQGLALTGINHSLRSITLSWLRISDKRCEC